VTTVAVVGAGGMGSVVAGFLARAGVDVVLVGRSPAHVTVVAESGLRLLHPDGSSATVELRATDEPASIGPVDHVIVLTKTFDNGSAAASAAEMSGPATWVTSLQNGLGNVEALEAQLTPGRVLPGTTTIGGRLHEPGVVSMSAMTAAGTSRTDVGPPPGAPAALAGAEELAAVLSSAGLPAEATADIDRRIWAKLALAVMGPVSALVRATVADTWAHPDGRQLVRTLHDEVVAVAAAEGVALDHAASWANAVATYEGTGAHYTSMATDLIAGRRTEIDAITGEVVRRAERLGVDVPTARAVVALLRTTQDVTSPAPA
jgi:2-dehydropantoate 2-reductase